MFTEARYRSRFYIYLHKVKWESKVNIPLLFFSFFFLLIISELDENAIAAQAFVFFAAGYETASATISFCLHELALNPDIQEKTRQDIADNMDEHDGKLTYECVSAMKYLDKVILGEFSAVMVIPSIFLIFF